MEHIWNNKRTRWKRMWLVSGLLFINIGIQLVRAKDHLKHGENEPEKVTVPRFTIPHPRHPESAFIPEATAVSHQRQHIVGTELPGAYGEDFDMETAYESGSGVSSGSGSGSSIESKDSESPESPGKYGTNLVPNPPPSNPSAAFMSNMNQTSVDDEERDEAKNEKDAKNSDDAQSHVTPAPVTTPAKTTSAKKVQKVDKKKTTKNAEKHKTKTENSHSASRKKSKVKEDAHEETNMISKIDAIAKQIERVEHRERLDRKEAATLKVAKKVAKKVIKNIAANKKHKKKKKKVLKAFQEVKEEEASAAIQRTEPIGPEGFECPWACFWTCHSYCPKECCNNPYHCDLACREFCTPYCSDRCCAPGSQRLPKLKIDFNGDPVRNNITAIFAEDDKRLNASNSLIKDVDGENAKPHMLDPAENSYQRLKEQEHQIALASQIEALKKATAYAAHLMGLPPECPLACARICLPGLCKQTCCARSDVNRLPIVTPQIELHHSPSPAMPPLPGATNNMAAPAAVAQGPRVNPSRNQLALANKYAMARKQQYLMAQNGLFPPNPAAAAYQQFANANVNFAMNKLAYRNRLLEGKNDFVPAIAQFRAMQYANAAINRQKMLMKNNLQAQASRQQIADASKMCNHNFPSTCKSAVSPSWLHNCPPICRSSCIPQCPNECCLHSPSSPPE